MNEISYETEPLKINNNDLHHHPSSSPSNKPLTQNTTDEPDIKIIIIGDTAVGKSKLLERYLIDDYNPRRLSTHALTLYRKNVMLGSNTRLNDDSNISNINSINNSDDKNKDDCKPIKVDFWDTAGQEKFSSLHPTYYYQAHACILVFDVTRKSTYHNLQRWYDEMCSYYSSSTNNDNSKEGAATIPCILVANKVDINYAVTKKSFKFATDHHMPFFFVSSADGTNVVKAFEEAICMALGQKRYGERDFLNECLELLEGGPLEFSASQHMYRVDNIVDKRMVLLDMHTKHTFES